MVDRMRKFQEDSKNLHSTLNASGRFSFQEKAMKYVVPDIVSKLSLNAEDELLDIGCNCGDITIPLSFLCSRCTGIDGEESIARMRSRISDYENIDLMVGNFFDLKIDKLYDCILIYSVLMYIDSFEEKKEFIKKACKLLKHGGRMLIGDIVNNCVKERLSNSETGKLVDIEYRDKLQRMSKEDRIKSQSDLPSNYIINDRELCDLLYDIRTWGYESYILPQDRRLPFGYSRQDILITRW